MSNQFFKLMTNHEARQKAKEEMEKFNELFKLTQKNLIWFKAHNGKFARIILN